MKKIKFDTHNDGIFEFGDYIETYDQDGNALEEKEFIGENKLWFSYKSIREEDRLRYDTTKSKISMKIKTRYLKLLNPSHTIKLDNKYYSVLYIDPDNKKENMYIYLTDLLNDLDKHVSIYVKKANGALEDGTWIFVKKVWARVTSYSYKSEKESVEANKLTPNINKNIVIRYLDYMDLALNDKATLNYKIKYENKFYNILQIINVDEANELLELSVKGE